MLPLLALFLQTAFPVQMGYRFDRDTVTVGDHVTLIIRVLAPHGAVVQFPAGPDTASAAGAIPMDLVGKRVTTAYGDTAVAGYRLSVWDVGAQRVNMPDVLVSFGGRTQHVSLAGVEVFVRSLLPKDSALRIPKPARPAIRVIEFDWRRLLIPLLALLALAAAAWLWWRRRRRAGLPVDPYQRARAEFQRVSTEFPADRSPERHYAGMIDVMRDYLAARVIDVRRSHTTPELLARLRLETGEQRQLPAVLERADLIKFARGQASAEEAGSAGGLARTVVDQTEARALADEAARRNVKKLERAA